MPVDYTRNAGQSDPPLVRSLSLGAKRVEVGTGAAQGERALPVSFVGLPCDPGSGYGQLCFDGLDCVRT